jgi:hypothetical protein
MVLLRGLKTNKTHQFIQVYMRRGPPKMSVQYGLRKKLCIYLVWII